MAVDRINKAGGINGRPIELIVADYESKPDVGRRKAEKLVVEDKIDAHVGGYLSNVCLACMPVWEEHKIVNMISVCLDTTITTSKCSRYSFRPFDYAPAQAVAFAPYLVNKMGKKWHIAYADYSWGQSTSDAYAEQIKKAGGEVVGTTGIPLGTADMTPFLSKITGDFDGFFGIFFGKDGRHHRQPGLRPRAHQEIQVGRRRRHRGVDQPAGARQQDRGLRRHQPLHPGPGRRRSTRRTTRSSSTRRSARLKQIDPSGPLPDRYVQSNYEAMNALKLGMEKSGFKGREDTMKLIEALEGLEMKEGDDFPQGDKLLRKEDHQAFLREFIFDIKDGKHQILEVVPKEKTIVPPACKFA